MLYKYNVPLLFPTRPHLRNMTTDRNRQSRQTSCIFLLATAQRDILINMNILYDAVTWDIAENLITSIWRHRATNMPLQCHAVKWGRCSVAVSSPWYLIVGTQGMRKTWQRCLRASSQSTHHHHHFDPGGSRIFKKKKKKVSLRRSLSLQHQK